MPSQMALDLGPVLAELSSQNPRDRPGPDVPATPREFSNSCAKGTKQQPFLRDENGKTV